MSAPYPLTGDAERHSVCVRFDPFHTCYEVVGTFEGSTDSERLAIFRVQAEAVTYARQWRDAERPDGLLCIESEGGDSWEVLP